jgi:phosphatidylserine/phosphatidylglycerophosphate/cardiolipin synthase-like enzyme
MANLYCTWTHRSYFSTSLRTEFGDLDHFVAELLSTARERLLLVAPYLSTAGMKRLRGPLAAAAGTGAWIRLVTGDLDDSMTRNFQAINALVADSDGALIRSRLRVLCAATGSMGFIHAKLIVADRSRGYLGSANLSAGGLDRNFEVGVALGADQAVAIERLIDCLEAGGLISDVTRSVLSA